MANYLTLPEGYREIFTVNLVEDRKMLLMLNGAAMLILIVRVIL